jgi:catechol 2,3-dioxygenase-like lactoylglutathione lyase family enzyme
MAVSYGDGSTLSDSHGVSRQFNGILITAPADPLESILKFNHINLVVADPQLSAQFYARYLVNNASIEWLGDSLHLRDSCAIDLAFQQGKPVKADGSHHGFLAESVQTIENLLKLLKRDGITITDDCVEEGFRSVKFLDPDGYEIEVYWEASWP